MSIDLSKIIGQPESETLEYKAVLPPAKTIAQIVTAFANTKGGVIILGVLEKGKTIEVVGLSEDFRANAIVHRAIDLLTPKPNIEYSYNTHEGKRIYVIEVEPSNNEVSLEGKVYKREGALSKLANPVQVEPKTSTYKGIEELHSKLQVESHTEAYSNFKNHYQSVLNLLSDLKSILYPESPSKPTPIEEGKILMRILFSSCADNFETYLSDLLYEIYLAKPETLKSEEMVTVKEVLDCSDIQEFINYFARKKLNKLKRGSVKAFIEENKQIEKLNAVSISEQKEVEKILQIRHLYAHNNGLADEKFIKYFPSYKLNDPHEMTLDMMLDHLDYLVNIVQNIDTAAIKKFKLASGI